MNYRSWRKTLSENWELVVGIIFICIAVALTAFPNTACGSGQNSDIDRWEQRIVPQYDYTEQYVVIRVRTYANTTMVAMKFAEELSPEYEIDPERVANGDTVHAYSNLNWLPAADVGVTGDSTEGTVYVCEVTIAQPKFYYDTSWYSLGHEVGHCLYGRWHERNILPKP